MKSNLFHAVFLLDNLAIKFKNRIRSQSKMTSFAFLVKVFFKELHVFVEINFPSETKMC